jgi:hypothetical protein
VSLFRFHSERKSLFYAAVETVKRDCPIRPVCIWDGKLTTPARKYGLDLRFGCLVRIFLFRELGKLKLDTVIK